MGRASASDEEPSVILSDGARARVAPARFVSGFELIVDGTPQSHVDLEDPSHLHFEYVHRMGAVIDQLGEAGAPLSAIHLGAGAMTLPRFIEHSRPGSRQQVIELEQGLIDLVREHIPLPRKAQIRVRIGDARAGLTRMPPALVGAADLAVSDVFAGAQTPAHLTTQEYYTEIARMLAPHGVLLINVADGEGLRFARRQVATVRSVFAEVIALADVQMLKGRRFGNIVIAASRAPLPTEWLPRLMAAGPHPAKVAEAAELDAFIAGVGVTTDSDATPSPLPASGLFKR